MVIESVSEKANKIIKTLRLIPEGHVASYGQIADLAGLPGRARLVGKTLRESAQSQNLPWFRVVRSNGQLAFPSDSSQGTKQAELLALERIEVIRGKVNLQKFAWQPSLADILFKLDE